MILTCPDCTSQFKVNAALIPAGGRKVRCASCKHEWIAYSEDQAGELTAPPAPQAPADDAPMDAHEEVSRLFAVPDTQPEWEAQAEAEAQAEDALQALERAQEASLFGEDNPEDQEPLDEEELDPIEEQSEAPEEDSDEDPYHEPELISSIAPDRPELLDEIAFTPAPLPPKKASLMPFALLAALLLIGVIVTSFAAFRSSLQPSFSGLYSVFGIHPTDGLSLTDVTVRERPARSAARYIIEGFIVNAADAPRHVPTVRVAMIGKDGSVLQSREYEDTAHPMLEPNERYAFKASNLELASKEALAWFVLDIGNASDLKLRSPTDGVPQVQLGQPDPVQEEPAHE